MPAWFRSDGSTCARTKASVASQRPSRAAGQEVKMFDRHVAFYARVSSERQTRENTIASQITALRERIAADGGQLEPDDAYIDEGYSGSLLIRPALERLRDAVSAGSIAQLYVLAPARVPRRYAHQALLMEEFRRADTEVVFLNRAISGTAEDDLLLQMQGVIAEYERAKILERSRRGWDTVMCPRTKALGWHASRWLRTRPKSFGWCSAGSAMTASACARPAAGCKRPGFKAEKASPSGMPRPCAACWLTRPISDGRSTAIRVTCRPGRDCDRYAAIHIRLHAPQRALRCHGRSGSRCLCLHWSTRPFFRPLRPSWPRTASASAMACVAHIGCCRG